MIAHIVPAKRGTLRLAYFDYTVPPELANAIKVGQLVLIPLRNRLEYGVVLALSEHSATNKLKSVDSIAIAAPLLSAEQLAFLQELGELYHVSLGFLVKNNLLPLKKRKLAALAKEAAPTIPNRTKQTTKPYCFVYTNEAQKQSELAKLSLAEQTLILVPEVNDIAPLQALLEQVHPGKSCFVTSDLGEKELYDLWLAIWRGEKPIIIGTRTALLLPFNNLGSIIVDNEGHEGHKSWDMAPRFIAREAAFFLGKHHGARVQLWSHTPSVETYYFAKHNVYEHNELTLKHFEHKKYSLYDIRAERRAGHTSHLGGDLLSTLKTTKGSAFLLCHRRGTMSYVSCADCKHVLTCPKCKRSLTYHRPTNDLHCHHCGHHERMIGTCPKCGGIIQALYGVGTEYVATEVRQQLANDHRPIVVLDMDTEIVQVPKEDCIIVGTSYAWRFLPWERLTILGIVDADTPLFVPEYRTAERLYLTMRDMLYRLPAGGQMLVQTNHPEHPIFAALAEPEVLYEQEIAQRSLLKYPPFRYLLKLVYGHVNEGVVRAEVQKAYGIIKELTKADVDCTITSPYTLQPYQYRGQYWMGLMIKLPFHSYKKYWRAISTLLPDSWKVDPNPLTIFSL